MRFLQRAFRQVRDLVTENGDLKLDVRRAKADNSILKVENSVLEDRLLAKSVSPSPSSEGDTAAGSDSGGAKRFYGSSGLARTNRGKSKVTSGARAAPPADDGKNGTGHGQKGGAIVPAREESSLLPSVVESKDDTSDMTIETGGGRVVGAKSETSRTLERGSIGSKESNRSELTVASACSKLAVARSASARGAGGHFQLSDSRRSGTMPNVLNHTGDGGLSEKTTRGNELSGVTLGGATSTNSIRLNSSKDRGGRERGIDKCDLRLEIPRPTEVPSSREQGRSSDGPVEQTDSGGKPNEATKGTLQTGGGTLDHLVKADRVVSAGTIGRFLSSESFQSRIPREHSRSSSLMIRNRSGRGSSDSVGSWTGREEAAECPDSPASMPLLVPFVDTYGYDDLNTTKPSKGTKAGANFTDTRSTTIGNEGGGNSFSSQGSGDKGTGAWSDNSAEPIANVYDSSDESSSEASSSTAARAWPKSGGGQAAYSSDEGESSGSKPVVSTASAGGEPSNTRGRPLARQRQRGGEAAAALPSASIDTERSLASRSSNGDSVNSSRSPVALERLSSAVKVVSSRRAG